MQNGEGTKAEMVPVDLQWFVLYCDANRPTLEQCNDMYDASSDYDYTDDRHGDNFKFAQNSSRLR